MLNITLVCFDCGKKKNVVINREPRFSFELVEIANEAGMYGIFDLNNSRSLVFCDKDCAEHSKTSKGTFRLRQRKVI